MQGLGKGFGQAVGQGLEHDRRIVVVIVLKVLFFFLGANAGRHRKQADVVGQHEAVVALGTGMAGAHGLGFSVQHFGRDEVRQAAVGPHVQLAVCVGRGGFFSLLAQAVPDHGHLAAALVGINLNVVAHAVGRVERHHAVGRQPAPFNQALEHALRVGIHAHGLGADHLVFQNRRERPSQVPGLKEGRPVNVLGQLGQVEVLEDAPADELGHRRRVMRPVESRSVGARLGNRPHRRLLFVGVLLAHFHVVGIELVDVLARLVGQQALRHADAARGVRHVDHGAFVMR